MPTATLVILTPKAREKGLFLRESLRQRESKPTSNYYTFPAIFILIHLNPHSSFVVKNLKELESDPYSSFPEYIQETDTSFCNKEIILGHFWDTVFYKEFVFDQADYQREL